MVEVRLVVTESEISLQNRTLHLGVDDGENLTGHH